MAKKNTFGVNTYHKRTRKKRPGRHTKKPNKNTRKPELAYEGKARVRVL